jgi:hypothetical protein
VAYTSGAVASRSADGKEDDIFDVSKVLFGKSGRPDLNRGLSAPKTDALPSCATPRQDGRTIGTYTVAYLSRMGFRVGLRYCSVRSSVS